MAEGVAVDASDSGDVRLKMSLNSLGPAGVTVVESAG